MIDLSRAILPPRQHQQDGVDAIVGGTNLGYILGLFDDVGAGKSKQIVDGMHVLFERGLLDTVVVLVPAFARGVWADPEIGEIQKHAWKGVPYLINEYCVRRPKFKAPSDSHTLLWTISNYEFIRGGDRLTALSQFLKGRKYWLICDESWCLTDHNTRQWKATNYLRQGAKGIVELNGTPGDPLSLYAQMRLLHPGILSTQYTDKRGVKRWTGYVQYRAEVADLVPNLNFPIVQKWKNLGVLQDKTRPYILRRKTRDCFDLPPILDPITIEARLTDETWTLYRQQRDDMVTWLGATTNGTELISRSPQAMIRAMRLRQITSGILGGIIEFDPKTMSIEDLQDGNLDLPTSTREVSREKLDAVLEFLKRVETPERLLLWAAFRLEVERTAKALSSLRKTYTLYGGQSAQDRRDAILALSPDIPTDHPVAVVGNPEAGGAGLNLAGASMAITTSHSTKPRVYLQARGRIDRPGQRNPIVYVDVIATGPKGQRTIDHHVLAALRADMDIAEWTASTWRKKLMED